MFFKSLVATATTAADAVTEAAATTAAAATEAAAETTAAAATTITALSTEVAGVGNWPIIGWIAILFGFLMRGIYIVTSSMNIYSCTLCIVIFTIITKMLILPLTIKQQKFSKVQALMNPEIMEIQKKYQNKKDQASMARMQAEQQAVYDKYGSSMTAGCLPSLIQLPILFALYPVIMYFGHYVPEIIELNTTNPELVEKFFTLFGSINLQLSPKDTFDFANLFGNLAWIIPILAGALQFLSVKLTSALSKSPDGQENPAASSMKTMTYIMPIMSVVICFTLPCFLGVYWVVQSLVMVVQQLIINKKFEKISVEEIIKENIAKTNKKRAKKGLPPISEKAAVNTKNIANEKKTKTEQDLEKRDEQIKDSTNYYNSRSAAPGSLAAKANMVRDYNERQGKK